MTFCTSSPIIELHLTLLANICPRWTTLPLSMACPKNIIVLSVKKNTFFSSRAQHLPPTFTFNFLGWSLWASMIPLTCSSTAPGDLNPKSQPIPHLFPPDLSQNECLSLDPFLVTLKLSENEHSSQQHWSNYPKPDWDLFSSWFLSSFIFHYFFFWGRPRTPGAPVS